MLRHEPFLEEAARRGAAHPLGQDPLVGYLALHAVDHAIQFGSESIPARHVAEKVLTEVLLLPDESLCKKAYFWVLDTIRRGCPWDAITPRLSHLADALELDGRYGEAEDVFHTIAEIHELPDVAAACGEPAAVSAMLGCARTLRKQAEFDQAETWYGKARERAHAAGLHDHEVSARVGQARLTIEKGNYPKAQKALDRIHRDFVGVELSPHARGSIFHEMAAATRLQDRAHALRLLWDAFEAYAVQADRERVLSDVANELLELGNLIPARKAFEVLERHGSSEAQGFALRGLVEIAWRSGDRVLFRRVWSRDGDRFANLTPTWRAETYMFAGNALRNQGNEEEGRALIEEAVSIAQTYGINEVLIRAEEFLAAPEKQIAPLTPQSSDAIELVSQGVEALWRADSLVPA